MSILLTGANGFLGREISKYLNNQHIVTLSRSEADFAIDLSKMIPEFLPEVEIVVHAAGKAHSVPKTNVEKQAFFDVNVTGTLNLLKGLESAVLPKSFIFISTVAVYGADTGTLIPETAPLNAADPYGRSKIEAELIVKDWCKHNKVICTILRLPLIAGPNPPGNLRSMINGIKKGFYFNIDGGKAKKSIVLAEDVSVLIPVVANIGGIYNLTDGDHPSFKMLSDLIAVQTNKKNPPNIPKWLARLFANVGDLLGAKAPINSSKLLKITSDLTFDDSKARQILNWHPTTVLTGFKIK
ncbi:NAD-dependent epimerase/dehydratase family protein [Mucilaginibacter sp.]|uniref:NAD-dependent epimerase/dehydratase family protein n=1 Tax=Mucilaginibacter sp. TaxID=1882438 RepID=UPI0035BC1F51